MNALVGQEAKANGALRDFRRSEGAHKGRREDGGDLRRAGSRGHFGRGWQFEGRHGSSGDCNCLSSWVGTSERDGNAGQSGLPPVSKLRVYETIDSPILDSYHLN